MLEKVLGEKDQFKSLDLDADGVVSMSDCVQIVWSVMDPRNLRKNYGVALVWLKQRAKIEDISV